MPSLIWQTGSSIYNGSFFSTVLFFQQTLEHLHPSYIACLVQLPPDGIISLLLLNPCLRLSLDCKHPVYNCQDNPDIANTRDHSPPIPNMCQQVQVKYACGCHFGHPVVVLPACDDLPETTPYCRKLQGPDRILKYACFNCKTEVSELYGAHLWSGNLPGSEGDGNESDSNTSDSCESDGNLSDNNSSYTVASCNSAVCSSAGGWLDVSFSTGGVCRSWFTDDGHLRSVVEVNCLIPEAFRWFAHHQGVCLAQYRPCHVERRRPRPTRLCLWSGTLFSGLFIHPLGDFPELAFLLHREPLYYYCVPVFA